MKNKPDAQTAHEVSVDSSREKCPPEVRNRTQTEPCTCSTPCAICNCALSFELKPMEWPKLEPFDYPELKPFDYPELERKGGLI